MEPKRPRRVSSSGEDGMNSLVGSLIVDCLRHNYVFVVMAEECYGEKHVLVGIYSEPQAARGAARRHYSSKLNEGWLFTYDGFDDEFCEMNETDLLAACKARGLIKKEDGEGEGVKAMQGLLRDFEEAKAKAAKRIAVIAKNKAHYLACKEEEHAAPIPVGGAGSAGDDGSGAADDDGDDSYEDDSADYSDEGPEKEYDSLRNAAERKFFNGASHLDWIIHGCSEGWKETWEEDGSGSIKAKTEGRDCFLIVKVFLQEVESSLSP